MQHAITAFQAAGRVGSRLITLTLGTILSLLGWVIVESVSPKQLNVSAQTCCSCFCPGSACSGACPSCIVTNGNKQCS